MPIDFAALEGSPRLLVHADLRPVQGTRFQPTGFPDLGAAEYVGPDGRRMLLVESAQSMANRLETVCWDDVADTWVPPLDGLPLVKVRRPDGKALTNSVLEAHRINSEYIARTEDFESIIAQLAYAKDQRFDVRQQLVPWLLRYDVNSLLHGVFLEEVAGVIRLPRAISAFIEAADVRVAASGGVKHGLEPGRKGGEGNVPFPRDEYVSPSIRAYFNVDLAQIRAFDLGTHVEHMLIAIALFKIVRFLEHGLRLRTACDLTLASGPIVTRPGDFTFPELAEVEQQLPELIRDVAEDGRFADPRVTTVTYQAGR